MSIESLLERVALAAERQATTLESLIQAFASATGAGNAAVGYAPPAPPPNTPLPPLPQSSAQAIDTPPPPAVTTVSTLPAQAPPKRRGRPPAATPAQQAQPPAAPAAPAPAATPGPAAAPAVPAADNTHPIVPSVKLNASLVERTGQAIMALVYDFTPASDPKQGRTIALGILEKRRGSTRVSQLQSDELQGVYDEAIATYAQLKSGAANQELI